jgi:hypothetical protein
MKQDTCFQQRLRTRGCASRIDLVEEKAADYANEKMLDLKKGEGDGPVVLRLAHVVQQEALHSYRTAVLLGLRLSFRNRLARLDVESLASQEARLGCQPEDRE